MGAAAPAGLEPEKNGKAWEKKIHHAAEPAWPQHSAEVPSLREAESQEQTGTIGVPFPHLPPLARAAWRDFKFADFGEKCSSCASSGRPPTRIAQSNAVQMRGNRCVRKDPAGSLGLDIL